MIFIGDIHGNFKYLKSNIDRLKIRDYSIIQVGDFNIGYNSLENDINLIGDLNNFLLDRNIVMYVVRGNHDDPKFFNGDYMLSNIKFVPDYTIINIDGYNVLFVGGAISINRKYLLELMSVYATQGIKHDIYWYDEGFKLDLKKIEDINNVDIVVTHTAPNWCYPFNNNSDIVNSFAYLDDNLMDDLNSERNDMDTLFKVLSIKNNIKYHYYGHFHTSYTTEHNEIKHILLNINEFKEMN